MTCESGLHLCVSIGMTDCFDVKPIYSLVVVMHDTNAMITNHAMIHLCNGEEGKPLAALRDSRHETSLQCIGVETVIHWHQLNIPTGLLMFSNLLVTSLAVWTVTDIQLNEMIYSIRDAVFENICGNLQFDVRRNRQVHDLTNPLKMLQCSDADENLKHALCTGDMLFGYCKVCF
jgi:hypothetical protein